MNILILRPRIEIGGMRTTIALLAQELSRRGHAAIVATCCEEEPGYLARVGIPVATFPLYRSHPINLLRSAHQLAQYCRRHNIHVLHSTHRFTSMVGNVVSRMTGVGFVVSVHEFLYNMRALAPFWSSPFTITPSLALKRHLITHFRRPPETIQVIYQGLSPLPAVEPQRLYDLRREILPDPSRLVVGYVGRLSPEKGGRYLIEAMASVVQQVPDAIAVIVGDGPERPQLQELVHALSLERSIIFTGARNDVPQLLKLMDVVAIPSLLEGASWTTVEAMAAARPLVATHVGGLSELIQDGVSGYLVPPSSALALAQALVKILSDSELRANMGKEGYRRFETEYSLATMVDEYLWVYETALQSCM